MCNNKWRRFVCVHIRQRSQLRLQLAGICGHGPMQRDEERCKINWANGTRTQQKKCSPSHTARWPCATFCGLRLFTRHYLITIHLNSSFEPIITKILRETTTSASLSELQSMLMSPFAWNARIRPQQKIQKHAWKSKCVRTSRISAKLWKKSPRNKQRNGFHFSYNAFEIVMAFALKWTQKKPARCLFAEWWFTTTATATTNTFTHAPSNAHT